MAKTTYVYLNGKGKWIRPTKLDPWGNWKMDLYPSPESLAKLNELKTTSNGVSGIKNEIKKDDEGFFITLRRPQQKPMKGKMVGFTPPLVLDKEGQPLRDVLIGNGSDVTVKCQLYTHGTPGGSRAKALRWEALRVDHLIPFEAKKDFDQQDNFQVKGMDAAPAEQQEPLF